MKGSKKSKLQCKVLGHKPAMFQRWNHEEEMLDGYCERCKSWESKW